jgi:hypothetical protein
MPTKEVVGKFNQLNNEFSARITKISCKEEIINKGKDKVVEKLNENKKCREEETTLITNKQIFRSNKQTNSNNVTFTLGKIKRNNC